jgi:competence CoiA-like predicted nuclease
MANRKVTLWILNDEGLYRMALDCIKQYRHWSSFTRSMTPRERAAHAMLDRLNMAGITHTPDGAKYTVTSIRAAMVGLA